MQAISDKQKLILFLLYCDPGIKDIKSMVNVYERADYPFLLGENLKVLFDLQLVWVTQYMDNDTPVLFELTDAGRAYVNEHIEKNALFEFIKTLQAPDFILEVTQSCFDKLSSN
ncbi:hypothetical protein [Flavisolibacter tropicus]|uniref:Transcription regulator PadR N-terminal domain-containing protein n=1 Tax=Flavisolibacter tropicus TaxID=1492898 RepID=A0A172TSK9_9BACT|nr:hypothetical protein [Flavisolibacter tropicus]ANE50079.1 hypothetical protein SY85_05780 [Flavisolibacter tropicus]